MGELEIKAAHDLSRIRVLIGSDRDGLRHELRDALANEADLDLVGEVADGEVALALLRRLRPDVALLDEDLPGFGGAAIARIVSPELPECRVVVLTGSGA